MAEVDPVEIPVVPDVLQNGQQVAGEKGCSRRSWSRGNGLSGSRRSPAPAPPSGPQCCRSGCKRWSGSPRPPGRACSPSHLKYPCVPASRSSASFSRSPAFSGSGCCFWCSWHSLPLSQHISAFCCVLCVSLSSILETVPSNKCCFFCGRRISMKKITLPGTLCRGEKVSKQERFPGVPGGPLGVWLPLHYGQQLPQRVLYRRLRPGPPVGWQLYERVSHFGQGPGCAHLPGCRLAGGPHRDNPGERPGPTCCSAGRCCLSARCSCFWCPRATISSPLPPCCAATCPSSPWWPPCTAPPTR